MGEKIVVGPINEGLRKDRTAFVIDNDSFPTLVNAYQWRGRIKRKRGTSFLNRLTRYFNSASTTYGSTSSFNLSSGSGNLLTGFNLQTNGNIVPSSVTFTVSGNVYTDNGSGVLTGAPGGSGTINYATGAITVSGGAANPVTSASFTYYPTLPVMGLEELSIDTNLYPGNIGFDTTYSYNMLNTAPYTTYDVSFYKNPATTTINGITYTQKTIWTPVKWNGQNYQQFWSTNYQGALWATNGVPDPFVVTNIGMQYKPCATVTYVSATQLTITITEGAASLVIGDWVFITEVTASGGTADASTINFQTGFITASANVAGTTTLTVRFPYATIAASGGGSYNNGILQYLTNNSDSTKDCLRWYDGDPTTGSQTPPVFQTGKGWVNFCPPLSQLSYVISDLPSGQYYLVGARMIIPFKDRLLFLGPVVQTSSANSQVYLQDTIIYSQNGTPYYTASFSGDILSANTVFHSLLTPTNQTATANSFFEDSIGFGGFLQAGISQNLLTVSSNEDVLILGFESQQSRLVYSGNDVIPFNLFTINSELGSSSTFSAVNLDRGVLTRGDNGFVMTSQVSAQRFDLDIPDQVFQIRLNNNGPERICSQRDFINEWIYFTYPSNKWRWNFPTQTLQYNYRDNTWAIFDESYTTYGTFRKQDGLTWATVGSRFSTWSRWDEPWNSGSSTLLNPQVMCGNTQGFVVLRDEGTDESISLEISNISFSVSITGATNANPCVLTANNSFMIGQQVTISGVGGMTQLNGNTYTITAVTPTTITLNVNSSAFGVYTSGGTATPNRQVYSPNHCLNNGDFIVIEGCIGTISSQVNGKVFQVSLATTNEFNILPPLTAGTYLGGGLIKRMYRPQIQTKQFPVSWGMGRKTRIGPQKYLFTTTNDAQITLLIYLSMNADSAYNEGAIVPDPNSQNNGLIYSSVLYTCTESANLGLTSANTNLQMISLINSSGTNASSPQEQIWHRMNTSLIGDVVQIGFTLSDDQMRDPNLVYQFAEIELHGFILDISPSQWLA